MTAPDYTFCNSAEDFGRYAVFDACKRWNGSPCASCKEHAELDAQLIQLLDQRRELRTKINQDHDPVTSMLPAEITSRIFEFSLPDDWFFGPLNGHQCGDDARVENDDQKLDFGPLILGAVCRAWRRIAWSTPSLWTAIHVSLVDVHRQCPRSRNHVEIVSDWLGRSGQLPLFIYLSRHTAEEVKYWDDSDPMGFKAVGKMYRRVIDLLNQHSGRWVHLQIADIYAQAFEELLGTDSQCAPRLRILKVENLRTFNRTPLFANMPGMKPHPRCVTLIDSEVKALDIQWNHVTNVSIRTSPEECFILLQMVPQLVHCKWEITNDLRMNRMSDDFNGWHSLLAHIKRSSCPITSLTLCNTSLSYGWVTEILAEIPLLRKLELGSRFHRKDCESDFFHLLSSASISSTSINTDGSTKTPFLPKLEIFEYTSQDEIFWNCIPDIVGSISQFDHPNRRPLNTLRIRWEETDNPYRHPRNTSSEVIGKETVLRLLELASAGVVLDLRDSTLRCDLLKIFMDHHGIIPPQ